MRLWDAATGQPRGKPLEHGKPLKSALIAPDGKSIASLDRDRRCRSSGTLQTG